MADRNPITGKQLSLDDRNFIEHRLRGAKGIIDVCRAVAYDGVKAGENVGLGDESLHDALWIAQDLIVEASDRFTSTTNVRPDFKGVA